MSWDNFQTSYATVIDGMLKNAVGEATKLFQTMVGELKEEMSKIKKENEDLKLKFIDLEKLKNQTNPEAEPRPAGKCETGIQCDSLAASIVSLRPEHPFINKPSVCEISTNEKDQTSVDLSTICTAENNMSGYEGNSQNEESELDYPPGFMLYLEDENLEGPFKANEQTTEERVTAKTQGDHMIFVADQHSNEQLPTTSQQLKRVDDTILKEDGVATQESLNVLIIPEEPIALSEVASFTVEDESSNLEVGCAKSRDNFQTDSTPKKRKCRKPQQTPVVLAKTQGDHMISVADQHSNEQLPTTSQQLKRVDDTILKEDGVATQESLNVLIIPEEPIALSEVASFTVEDESSNLEVGCAKSRDNFQTDSTPKKRKCRKPQQTPVVLAKTQGDHMISVADQHSNEQLPTTSQQLKRVDDTILKEDGVATQESLNVLIIPKEPIALSEVASFTVEDESSNLEVGCAKSRDDFQTDSTPKKRKCRKPRQTPVDDRVQPPPNNLPHDHTYNSTLIPVEDKSAATTRRGPPSGKANRNKLKSQPGPEKVPRRGRPRKKPRCCDPHLLVQKAISSPSMGISFVQKASYTPFNESSNTLSQEVNLEDGSVPVSATSLSKGCSSEDVELSELEKVPKKIVVTLPSTEVSSAAELVEPSSSDLPNTKPLGPKECHNSYPTIEDAMLLVDAMNALTSTLDSVEKSSSKPTMAAPTKLQSTPPPFTFPIASLAPTLSVSTGCPQPSTTAQSSQPSTVSYQIANGKPQLQKCFIPIISLVNTTHSQKIIVVQKPTYASPQIMAVKSLVSKTVEAQRNNLPKDSSSKSLSISPMPSLGMNLKQSVSSVSPETTTTSKPKIKIVVSRQVATIVPIKQNPTLCPQTVALPIAQLLEPQYTAAQTLSLSSHQSGVAVPLPTVESDIALVKKCDDVWRNIESNKTSMQNPLPVSTSDILSTSDSVSTKPGQSNLLSKVEVRPSKSSSDFCCSDKNSPVTEHAKSDSHTNQEQLSTVIKLSKSSPACTEGAALSSEARTILLPACKQAPSTTVALAQSTFSPNTEHCPVSMTLPSSTDRSSSSNKTSTCMEVLKPVVQDKTSAVPNHVATVLDDTVDVHSQISKTMFLAQLSMSPVVNEQNKELSNDGVAETNGSSNGDQFRKSYRLRSHLKSCQQAGKTVKLLNEPEHPPISAKKPRLANNVVTPRESINESADVGPQNGKLDKDESSSNRSNLTHRSPKMPESNKHAHPEESSLTKNDSKMSNSERPTRSTFLKEGSSKSTAPRPRRTTLATNDTRHKTTSKQIAICSKSASTNKRIIPKRTPDIHAAVSLRSRLVKDNTSPREVFLKPTPFCPRRPRFSKDGSKREKTADTFTNAMRCRSGQVGASPKKSVRLANTGKMDKALDEQKKSAVSKAQKKADEIKAANNPSSGMLIKTGIVWIPPIQADNKPPLKNTKKLSRITSKRDTKSCHQANIATPNRSHFGTAKIRSPSIPTNVSPNGRRSSSSNGSPVSPRTVRYSRRRVAHQTPVRTPFESPMEPLSVIGERLLRNQCGQCGCILSSPAALQSHVSLHSGKPRFSCTFCGKNFKNSKTLSRHGRVHQNGKIYNCPQCNKGFAYRFGLTKHLQMVHGSLKPFVCHICSKGFFTKRDLETHVRVHTGERPFSCNLCEKQFNRRVMLNVHLRRHNGEKRHWCPYCGKGFLDFNNLKIHKYTHTGERPHPCAHCTKRFVQSSHLKKHLRNVHKVE